MFHVLVHQEDARRGLVVTAPARLPSIPRVGETIRVEGEVCLVESVAEKEGHPAHLTVRVLTAHGYGG